ncbi:bifunctional UDP-N-acetylglucosamine diphosphorylase/glucosamine-1-phosphate N-acetyltransferase GlmU [Alkaliphilus peptidifermentans]|uniref:Bifunctional protein GlmU n=1 Tax=Alkaliphilus peptidifermentans DSM 18978 TaxID=1120976 RepID=A0A1G5ALF8_9FIRM|nr:bifunctional UDP-N-acetylglucosamine diphosphorylase/glucosamine-1-phosphate N-acetyltransferase GlmU [Alkaliphilus peptidifermentans]SCX78697.1 UDP-N-acetylglucosamine pyrophosphorylase /glucosamine-1-phosphate N-acetyltransferase [Alkaliphilus peptidifermentans DSM 18978]
MGLKAIILAAGEGKRMKSRIPKVLHKVCGQTMLGHVIDAANSSNVQESIVVVGHGADAVKESLPTQVRTVLQAEQLGTGHAVMMAYDHIEEDGTVLVLYGDGPLITEKTLNALMEYHTTGSYKATVLTTDLENPHGYGRIVRDSHNGLDKIVEEKDATEDQKSIKEINSGIYCFSSKDLKEALPMLKNENKQKEYYLTDVLTIIKDAGKKVGLFKIEEHEDIMAVNSREQLAQVEEIMRNRINLMHMIQGVTLINPQHTYIEKSVKIGIDTIVYPGVILEGATTIGEDCIIGANTKISNSSIGNSVEVQSSTVTDSQIDDYAAIGPYAYLRPNSKIGKHVKIGDFVEVKNSVIGDHSKASHLAYVGDAEVGKNVNIGCGVVFVNYNGKEKNKTIIEDNAFIGSNSNLVAPVTVKEEGYVACGSTITKEVPKGALAIARTKQENKTGWTQAKGFSKE